MVRSMLKEIMFRYNPWWESEFEFPGIRRNPYLSELGEKLESRRLVFIYGLRRVGKTYIMKQFVADGIANGNMDPERILFVSVDHPAFSEISLLEIIDNYREIFALSRDMKIYVLFDEIQSRPDFEKELKSIYDLEENVYMIASGSNSLVIKHKSGALTGRNARMNVLPLSFDEFLEFRGIVIKPSEKYLEYRHLEEYMLVGGLPEYVLTGDPQYVADVVEDIIYKDIVPRYGVKDPLLLKNLFYLLCNRVGKRLTVTKLARLMGISNDSVSSYLRYFQETYLIDLVVKEGSPNEQIYAPKKVYVCDPGIMSVIGGSTEKGAMAENLVYFKLKGMKGKGMKREGVKGKEMNGESMKGEGPENRDVPRYVEQNSREIDFLVDGIAYEVKYKDVPGSEDVKNLKMVRNRKIRDRFIVGKKNGNVDGVKVIGLIDLLRM